EAQSGRRRPARSRSPCSRAREIASDPGTPKSVTLMIHQARVTSKVNQSDRVRPLIAAAVYVMVGTKVLGLSRAEASRVGEFAVAQNVGAHFLRLRGLPQLLQVPVDPRNLGFT